jgi:hypothetical protein
LRKEGFEPYMVAQDFDGRDVGVALGPAGVLAFGEDRGGGGAHLVFAQRGIAAQNARVARKARGEMGSGFGMR